MTSKSRQPSQVASDERQPAGTGPAMGAVMVWIEPRKTMLFKAIIESYDNLATLRTEDPARHHLRLCYGIESEAEVMELLAGMADEFSLRRIE
ncbi:MAG TPA: DUF4911 domain-containing protein [Candidatus Binataceae bacterium]|nr:DUF4911 domain-containing protein [Candidatus Binataceae bacterium]